MCGEIKWFPERVVKKAPWLKAVPVIMKIRIKTKLVLSITILVILTAIILGYLSYNKSSNMLVQHTRERLLTDAEIYSDMIDKYIYERSRDCLIMARHPVLMDEEASGAEKSAVLKRFKQDYEDYASISLTDSKGLQIADSDGNVGEMKDQKEWFQEGIKGLYISDVRISTDLQKPVLSFACPVPGENGGTIGVLTTRLVLENTIWAMVDDFAAMQSEQDKSGYAYMVNEQGVLMAHPQREKVLTENIMEMGIEGLKIAGAEMIKGKSGFDRYTYEGVDKYVAYVSLDGWGKYEGKGWSVALTSPVDDFLAPVYDMRNYILLTGLVVVALALLLSYVLARQLTAPISQLLENVQQVAQGDLTRDVDVHSRDEIGELAGAFNQMTAGLRNIIDKVKEICEKVTSHSQELAASGQEVNATVEEIASTSNEVAATSEQSAENARSAEADSKEMREVAEEGGRAVQQALEKINSIADNTGAMSQTVNQLGHHSERIGRIINTITDIADQTNLLALNAAIEAARAGEHGRGFAVVAEEVRKLAEQSAQAAGEITQLISQIQSGVGEAVAAMDKGSAEVEEGVQLAGTAGTALDKIVAAIGKNTEMIKEITAGAAQVSEGTQQLSASTQQITSAVQEVSSAAQELADIAAELQQAVEMFKVSA